MQYANFEIWIPFAPTLASIFNFWNFPWDFDASIQNTKPIALVSLDWFWLKYILFVRCRHWNLFSGGGAVLNSNLHHRQLIHSLEKSKQPSSGKNMKPKILGLPEQYNQVFKVG